MARFILIENPGVASPESFTLLGASNKAGTDAIGQFGSGTKFGVLACLRKGINPVVYCGNLSLSFETKPITFGDTDHKQVAVRLKGKDASGRQVNRTEDLSVVLNYGKIDWKDDVKLALREFVSNALDATNGDASQIRVELVDTDPRAKAGVTRVYIPCTTEGEDFVRNLSEWFLHFNPNKVDYKSSHIIEKNEVSPARIYRRGVLVRKVERINSLFDYNLNSLPLDEARVANDWTVQYHAETAFNKVVNPTILARLLSAPVGIWETKFDLTRSQWDMSESEVTANRSAWASAQEAVLDDRTIFVGENEDISLAQGKGYNVIRLNSERYNAVLAKGLRTVAAVLTVDEREGRRVDPITNPAADRAVRHVWDKLVALNATNGEKYPTVRSYTEHSTGNGRTLGLWKGEVVYINNTLLSGAEITPDLFAVCLEELAHHITKATDNSRGFQEYFIRTLTKVLR